MPTINVKVKNVPNGDICIKCSRIKKYDETGYSYYCSAFDTIIIGMKKCPACLAACKEDKCQP